MLKSKPCSYEGCNMPVWANKLCRIHGNKEYTLSSSSLKSSGRINRQSEKHRSKAIERKQYGEDMMAFFLKIWEERPHYCYETGVFLGDEPNTMFFDHVLPKSVYKTLAFTDENILLLHPDTHAQKHVDIDKTPKVKAYRDYLLNQIENANRIL